MGCSQNYGPLLVIDSITAPNIRGAKVGPCPNFGSSGWGLGFRVQDRVGTGAMETTAVATKQ